MPGQREVISFLKKGQLQGRRERLDGEVLRRLPLPRELGNPRREAVPAGAPSRRQDRPPVLGRRACVGAQEEREGAHHVRLRGRGGRRRLGRGQLPPLVAHLGACGTRPRRSLYLGWLLCAQSGDLDDDDLEPPVPAGLPKLSASLESLATARMEIAVAADSVAQARDIAQRDAAPISAGRSGRRLNNESLGWKRDDMVRTATRRLTAACSTN